jgi:hypothetical protein
MYATATSWNRSTFLLLPECNPLESGRLNSHFILAVLGLNKSLQITFQIMFDCEMLNCSLHSGRRHDHSIEADENRNVKLNLFPNSPPESQRARFIHLFIYQSDKGTGWLLFDFLTRSPCSCAAAASTVLRIVLSVDSIHLFLFYHPFDVQQARLLIGGLEMRVILQLAGLANLHRFIAGRVGLL